MIFDRSPNQHPAETRTAPAGVPRLEIVAALALVVLPATAARDDVHPIVYASEVLPPAYFRSVNYVIDNEVRAEEYFYHFKVTSDFGNFDIASVSVLRKRLHEIEVLAAIEPTLAERGLKFDRSPGGRRGVDSDVTDILTNPVGTAGKLLDNLRYNFDETFGEGQAARGPSKRAPRKALALRVDPGPHKRSAANQLGVDVYTSNQRLQATLDELARARSSGRLRDSVAPVAQIKVKPREFGTGLFDTRIASRLKNNSASEINAEIGSALDGLGVDAAVKIELLSHPAYTPRDALYLVEYLRLMSRVENSAAFVDGALGATTEADVAAYVNLVRMLAFFHLSETKLKTLVSRGGFPIVISHGDDVVVPLPVDYLPWNGEIKTIVEGLKKDRSTVSDRPIVMLLVGTATEDARSALLANDVRLKERYSF